MMKHEVRNTDHALAYIVDCTLATVCSMAMKKSRPKGEYQRQKNIAQEGINWMKKFDVDPNGTRANKIILLGITVDEWAKRYEE